MKIPLKHVGALFVVAVAVWILAPRLVTITRDTAAVADTVNERAARVDAAVAELRGEASK